MFGFTLNKYVFLRPLSK